MNRLLQYLNSTGVVAMVCICCAQWKTNSDLDHQLSGSKIAAINLSRTVADQRETIQQDQDDLETGRQRLAAAESENRQSQHERDKLKSLVDHFVDALKARDQLISQQADVIHQLARARDDAIRKANELLQKENGSN